MSNKSNKTNSEKENSLFFFTSGFKNGISLMYCGQKMILIHANSAGLSVSLPDTAPISHSPVRVTISPGQNHLLSFSVSRFEI